jgi:tetratricopeptide (TPR) repeat protein
MAAWAQEDEAAKANALWSEGKRLDALPLYEDLARDHPKEWMYQERLAVALGVKAEMTTDAAEVKALLTRERDAAKRAVELGDPNYFMQLTAQLDPNAPLAAAPGNPAQALQQEAEKAFGTGDYATALAKYSAAADADPKLYEAPLYAGDTAYSQKDLKTAARWFARAISVDPNRETAYRYWGDALMRIGHDPAAAKEKYIDAIVAEPYNRLAWQGIQQWAQAEKAVILAPKIDRPAGPVVDAQNPKNMTINIDPGMTDEKKNPGGYAWLGYGMARAAFHGDEFKKAFPDEKQYRHTLKEEDTALGAVAEIAKQGKVKRDSLDESLRDLVDLNDAGMLDCWILINGADQGIAQDYAAYRNEHRQLLHDYLERFVLHGGVNSTQ